MMEFVPIALACGHVLQGVGHFQIEPGKPGQVMCPEGCGWQRYVVEPSDMCPNLPAPGERCEACGEHHNVMDLGELDAGDTVVISELMEAAEDDE